MIKKGHIEIIARAVILHKNKILLCKQKKASHYFLPGGHIEFGEPIEKGLVREIREELGVPVKKIKFLRIAENWHGGDGRKRHEVNFIYQVTLKNWDLESKEGHIEFYWNNGKTIRSVRILPVEVKKFLTSLI